MYTKFSDSDQMEIVSTFPELISAPFKEAKNAICWYRELVGDFNEIVSQLQLKEDLTAISIVDLQTLKLSAAGNRAREIILTDLQLLTATGAMPSLNLIKNYKRDDEFSFIATDVYSYHVDRAPIATATFLCTYHGAVGDILPNSQAQQKILVPAIRQKLKELHDGPEDEFENFLSEYYFDLHYQPEHGAKPTNLGLGHLWKLAVDHPEQQALPCIHRAPVEKEGEYRLLLIC